jgi:hypothetical protein
MYCPIELLKAGEKKRDLTKKREIDRERIYRSPDPWDHLIR